MANSNFWWNAALAIVLMALAGTVVGQDDGEHSQLHVTYIADEYIKVSVADASKQTLISRKLVTGQSFSLPLQYASGKRHKYFNFMVGKRSLKLKVACKSKQYRKNLAADAFEVKFSGSLSAKPPCFVKDDGPSVNLPPAK